MNIDGPEGFSSEISINNEVLIGLVAENSIRLYSRNADLLGTISGLRRGCGNILAFFQQPCDIFHRSFNNVVYLWVVFEGFIDFVYCDAKRGFDITSGTTLSFCCRPQLGVLSKFETLDSHLGKGTLICAYFNTPTATQVIPFDASLALFYSEKVRKGEVPSDLLPEIDLSSIERLSVPEGLAGAASNVVVNQLSVRCSVLTPISPNQFGRVQDWALALAQEMQRPAFSFTAVVLVDGVVEDSRVFTSAKQKIIDFILVVGPAAAFANGRVLIDLSAASEGEVVGGLLPGPQRLPLWQACLAYRLMSLDRLNEISEVRSRQAGSESDWFCRSVVLEAALANGLSGLVADYVLLEMAEGDVIESDRRFLLQDVVTVEHWVEQLVIATEAVIRDQIETAIVPYLMRKSAINYEEVAGQHSSLPIAITHEMALRLKLVDGISAVLAAMIQRKALTSTPSSSNPAAGTSPLENLVQEVRSLAGILRVLTTICKHSNLSLRCFYPARLPVSAPSVSLSDIRRRQADVLSSTAMHEYLPSDCVSNSSLLVSLLRRSLGMHLPPNWEDSDLLMKRHFSAAECEAWTVSLFLLPLTVLRQQRHRPDATEIAAFAQMVVIFQVLDALWSAVSDSVTPLEARRLVDELCFVMSTGFQLTQPQQRLVLSLWKFEANVDVGTATRDFTTFSSSFVAEDPDLVVDVIRKCLSWEQFSARSGRPQSSQLSIPRALSCSSKVLTYFTSKANSASSRYLLSPLGAAFMMASALDKDSWEMGWDASRRFCRLLPSSESQAEGRKTVVSILCNWTAQSPGLLASLLLSSSAADEAVVIDEFLRQRVAVELSRSVIVDTPTLHIYVHWLLRHHRFEEARQVEASLLEVLQSRSEGGSDLDSLPPNVASSMRARRLTLQAFDQFSHIPANHLRQCVPNSVSAGVSK